MPFTPGPSHREKTRQTPTAHSLLGIGPTTLGTSQPCFYFFLSFSKGQNLTEIHRKRLHFWLSSPLASLHCSMPSVPQPCPWEGPAQPPRLTSKTAASSSQPHYNSTDIQNGEVQKAKAIHATEAAQNEWKLLLTQQVSEAALGWMHWKSLSPSGAAPGAAPTQVCQKHQWFPFMQRQN